MPKQNALPPFLTAYPAVYATENKYRIFVSVRSSAVLWVTVKGERFDDAVCGVLRSGTLDHRVTIPMEVLDRAGEYILHWRRIPERKPYFTEAGDEETAAFRFCPLPETGDLRICHISDTHGLLSEAVRAKEIAAETFGEPNLILLTGTHGIYLNKDDPSTLVEQVEADNIEEMRQKVAELMGHCEGASRAGANGAKAKLAFALRAVEHGTNVMIGHAQCRLDDLLSGRVPCTRLTLRQGEKE